MAKKNTNKNKYLPKFFKSKVFVFIFLSFIMAIATFAMFLIDKSNSVRPAALNLPFFTSILEFLGIKDGLNVSITTWALFLIIFGLAYVIFAAVLFYGVAITNKEKKALQKHGTQISELQVKSFKAKYTIIFILIAAVFGVLVWLFFPWDFIDWSTVNVLALLNVAECLALIVGLIVIIPLSLAIIYFAFVLLVKLFVSLISSVSRGVIQSQGYQEALVATQIATKDIVIDAYRNMELAKEALESTKYSLNVTGNGGSVPGGGNGKFQKGKGGTGGNQDGYFSLVFPSLSTIDFKYKELKDNEDASYKAACEEAIRGGAPLPEREMSADEINEELGKFSVSPADKSKLPSSLLEVDEEGKEVVQKEKKMTPAELAAAVNVPENELKDFATRFQAFLANRNNLYFDLLTLRSFISGLSASRLILLQGLSGTGKTSLPRAFLEFVGGQAHFYPVQATWRDRTDLLGYYSDLVEQFKETQMLEDLYEASYTPNKFNIMVLDEMNISRTEYYFADFLSVFEYPSSDWYVNLMNVIPNTILPKHIPDGRIRIPVNTWFVGTVNIDDSTFTITDKVYDRAIVIDFREMSIPFKSKENDEPRPTTVIELYKMFEYAQTNSAYSLRNKEKEKFIKLCNFVSETLDIQFGNRIIVQIERFLPVFVALGGTKEEALDVMFAQKILRKIDGRLETYIFDGLNKLQKYIATEYGKNVLKETERMIEHYKRKFN